MLNKIRVQQNMDSLNKKSERLNLRIKKEHDLQRIDGVIVNDLERRRQHNEHMRQSAAQKQVESSNIREYI